MNRRRGVLPTPRSWRRGEREDWAAFTALLAFTLVVYLRPQDLYPALGVLRLGMMTATAAAGLYVVSVVVNRHPITILTAESVLMMFFFGFVLLSVPSSLWPGGSTKLVMQVLWKLILIFFLVANTVRTLLRLRILLVTILGAMVFLAANAVRDAFTGRDLIRGFRASGVVEGMLGDPNDLAMAMVIVLPFALTLAILSRRKTVKVLCLGSVVLLLSGIVFTYSRGGMVGLIPMGITFAWIMGRGKRVLAMLLCVICLLTGFFLAPQSYQERISSVFHPERDDTGSMSERLELFRSGLHFISEHPVLGVGANCFGIADGATHRGRWRVAHNTFVEVTAEIGLVGGLVFIGNFILALARVYRVGRVSERLPGRRELMLWSYAVTASMVGFATCAFFLSHQYTWHYYYLIGFSVVLQRIARREGVWEAVAAARVEKARQIRWRRFRRPGEGLRPLKNRSTGNPQV